MNLDSASIEERLFVVQAQHGDRESFSRLIDLYDNRLRYFIRRLGVDADEALDVLQSVWLIVHRKLCALKSPEAFRVWLYRIAHDQAINNLRKRAKFPALVEQLEAPSTAAESANVSEPVFDNAELVHVAMEDLSVNHRRVLTLRFLEDMSIQEIAKVINDKPGTVKSRLHYAKQALRRRIEEELNG